MSTLAAIVRELAAATEAEASNTRILEALENSSVQILNAPVVWDLLPSGARARIGRIAIGKYRVEATGATASVPAVEFHDYVGAAIEGHIIDQRGTVRIDDEDVLPGYVRVTGRAYDVYAAAAEIVGVRIANAAAGFDFKRGDQDFKRSQIAAGLRALQKDLRRQRVPRRRGEMVMRDQAAGSCGC